MAYKPIESYGVIGDLHTVALVGMDGSIDWCCLPQFDSPSIFAAILDDRKGGFFKIASLYEAQHKQMYLPDSNVLLTRFLSPEGVGEVVDFMPIQDVSRGKKVHQIVRVVRAVRGAVRFRLECQPAFDYARRPHQVTLEGRGAVFEAPGMRFSLVSRFPLARQGTGVATEFLLHPGEPSTFILRQVEGDGDSGLLEARLVGTELLTQTLEFWRRWVSKCRYDGRWREMVNRSALMLKLLTFAPTGAIDDLIKFRLVESMLRQPDLATTAADLAARLGFHSVELTSGALDELVEAGVLRASRRGGVLTYALVAEGPVRAEIATLPGNLFR